MNVLTVIDACCSPGARPLAEEARHDLAARFKALADPTRVAIVNLLAGARELCVCVLVEQLGLSQPTISHHLRILREAGLVNVERRGTWAYYSLAGETVAALAAALGGGDG
jgi:ArsR family transcriptional regulator, arsenate/arsenite/antimonite-responsive transcriptional repressor